MANIIKKYREEAYHLFNSNYGLSAQSWRAAILEAIFRPTMELPPGKGPLTHLHPDLHKLHLPDKVMMPDWRKYRVEDHKALMAFQKRCHAAGLHDPWLRNRAYCFYPNMVVNKSRFAFVMEQFVFGVFAGTILWGCRCAYMNYMNFEQYHTEEYKKEMAEHHHHGAAH